MFLAIIIPAFLSPCVVPTAECEIIKSRNLSNFGNQSLAFQNILLSPFESIGPLAKLHLLQSEFPDLLQSPYDLTREYKNGTKKGVHNSELSKRNVPVVRVPRVHSKDYGQSSHYRMKGGRDADWDSTKKNFYFSILQKLLRPGSYRSSRKGKDYYGSSKYSSPTYYTSSAPMDVAAGGWGWSGWSKGHGGHGISLLDAILCGLSFLSLGGFLLNLLLNLLNIFGFGMTTSTSTYPVTVTQTQTATSTSTGGGTTGGTAITYPTALTAPVLATGWGITGRTIDSMAGNGWGPGGGTKAVLKGHVKFGGSKGGWGWPSTTTTTTTEPPPTEPTLPTLTGTGGTGGIITAASIFASGRKKRRKRESFQPYVNPSTALNIFAKAILNSIDAATHKYECIEKIYCENNKQARVIGQWLDYFMPVYSFSLSYFGHRVGAHERLVDHIRAIVLGVAETNCQAHFPRCDKQ